MKVVTKPLTTQAEVLEDAGYEYNFERRIYFNSRMRRAFSIAWLDDHSVDELKVRVAQRAGKHWDFVFTDGPLSEWARRDLEQTLS